MIERENDRMVQSSTSAGEEKNCAIGKAADILKAFVPGNRELGTIEISRRLGIHKATASRILLTLVREDFLRQDPHTKKFKLGRNALLIGRSAIDSLNTELVALSQKHLDDLADRLKETVLLKKVIGAKSIILYVAREKRAIRIIRSIGERMPVMMSSGGRAILAFSQETGHRNMSPEMKGELSRIRKNGYALNNEEGSLGVTSVGVPIFNSDGDPVAAVVVTGPGGRMRMEADAGIVDKIKMTARRIGEEMAARGVEG
jgi:DNA-binding IclR family transcriptional regulator